ncbi:MAG: hypothetical protein CM15mP58_18640 [Burkholderiaceae bacterium]|nr:MAG: hypothetical protein CM15mP58_18640 [Burkholderiaceae bacterium]
MGYPKKKPLKIFMGIKPNCNAIPVFKIVGEGLTYDDVPLIPPTQRFPPVGLIS